MSKIDSAVEYQIKLSLQDIRTDGGTQPRATLDPETVREYADDLVAGARFPPVVVFYDGTDYWLADGFHRYFAYYRAERESINADVRQGTLAEAQWYSYSVNQAHGLRRTNEDKRRAVEAALKHPYAGQRGIRDIARHCGVSEGFVHKLWHNPSVHSEQMESTERTVTRSGVTYTMDTGNIGRREKPELTPAPASEPAPIETPTPAMAVHYSSETPEWYTPQHILDCSIATMGAIDMDPCSNSHTAPNVPAAVHFTQEDDGLSFPWMGRVYMNPPYGREIVGWIEHLVAEYRRGNVTEGIALVPARTDTEWFRLLREFPRCFIWGRLKFSNNDNAAPFPSMAVYLGANAEQFVKNFKSIGDIYQLIEA